MRALLGLIAILSFPAIAQTDLTCIGEVTNGYYEYKPEYKIHEKGREIDFSYQCNGEWPEECTVSIGGEKTSARRYINSNGELIIGLAEEIDMIFYVDSRKIQLKMKDGDSTNQRWFYGVCSRA